MSDLTSTLEGMSPGLLVALALLLVAALRPVNGSESFAYHWPIKPFDRQHPIRGAFGDPRTLDPALYDSNQDGLLKVLLFQSLLDITNQSDLVTVSWCRFQAHDKTMLIGSSDSKTADDGRLRVTQSGFPLLDAVVTPGGAHARVRARAARDLVVVERRGAARVRG